MKRVLEIGVLAVLVLVPAVAQTPTGQVTGQVSDPSGAVIVGARVTVVNVETGVKRETVSNEAGNYRVPLLPPGSYRITVQMQGFRPISRSGLALQVDQVLRIDYKLDIGSVSEAVEITAEAPMLERETAAIGTVIDNQKILDLPLNTRNPFRLALLAPGVIPGTGFGDQFNTASGFRVNGGRANSNEILVDGVTNALSAANPILVMAMFPSPDALQEFKVQTNSYSAEYGRSGGGVINMVMKSGTNHLHSTLYEFLRNSRMDANNFFANQAGRNLPSFKRNQFGGTIGGPIVKDKLFYFINYEGLRQRAANTVTRTVPTDIQKRGDFSQTYALVGGQCVPVTIHDAVTTRRNAAGTAFVRDPFPGSQIPASRLDRVAAKTVTYYPAPNTTGNACTGINNFFSAKSSSVTTNQIDAKLDWAPTSKDRAFLGLGWRKREDHAPNHYGTVAEPSPAVNGDLYPSASARLDYTRVQTNALVLNFRAGVSRMRRDFNTSPEGFHLTDLGFPSLIETQTRLPIAFPQVVPAGYGQLGWDVSYTFFAATTYSWNASATWTKGRHTLRFGLDARVNQSYEDSGFGNHGNYSFGQAFTQGPDPIAPRADRGNSIASLLLGTGQGFVQVLPGVLTSNRYAAAFLQDDIKLTSRLTLNLGLRYDFENGRKERFNQLSWFDFDAPSPLAAKVPSLPNLRGGLRFPGVDGDRQFDTDKNNFGPRAGLAYSVNAKTVLRAGYGIFYLPYVGVASGTASGINGFLVTTNWVSSADGGMTPLNYFSNPFPTGIEQPTGSRLGLATNVGQTFGATRDGAIDRGARVGYSQQWNFNIQRELPKGVTVEAAYTGSKGTKLMDNGWQLNQLGPQYLALGTALLETVPNPFLGVIQTGTLAQPRVTRGQLLRPYPQFLGVMNFRPAAASSIYHAFQLSAQRRFANGSTFLLAYTNGKLIDDSSGINIGGGGAAPGHQDAYNRRGDRSISAQDVSQRLVLTYIYELPFGRNRVFGAAWSRWADLAFGNWQVNGACTFSTSVPLIVTAPNNSNAYSDVQRPNVMGDPKLPGGRSTSEKLNRWFNTAAFTQTAPFTFGNGPRTLPNVRADGIKNFDFSLFKEFPLAEKKLLQFRAETFNLMNTPQFGGPGTGLGGAGFGVVSAQANSPREVQLGLKLVF